MSFAEAPLKAEALGDASDPDVERWSQQVHALGARARDSEGEDQAAVYGELLTTCAACHERTLPES